MLIFRINEYLMDTYYFFGPLMMHMSHILVFRMILKVHLSLEQKRILIVDNFLKKIKVSRQLNWHKVPLNLQKIFVVFTKLLTSPADLLRESEHKLHLVGKFIFKWRKILTYRIQTQFCTINKIISSRPFQW